MKAIKLRCSQCKLPLRGAKVYTLPHGWICGDCLYKLEYGSERGHPFPS